MVGLGGVTLLFLADSEGWIVTFGVCLPRTRPTSRKLLEIEPVREWDPSAAGKYKLNITHFHCRYRSFLLAGRLSRPEVYQMH